MSLKRKESGTNNGGLRVATDSPHLVSLGGGRLSTAVTIHHLPIGGFTIGSSPTCGVILNGSGVQPLHCTLYRNESNEVIIVPEPEARTLIDGNKVIDDSRLSQGAMLTIGKSNYLRFNNPAEAQLIKSTMGSNERISMPQIDFTQDSSSSSNGGSPEEVFQNLNDFLESHNVARKKSYFDMLAAQKANETQQQQHTTTNHLNNYQHSPKVFTADSVTVNAPAKDVLGVKYNNFAKHLPQNSVNFSENNVNGKLMNGKPTSPPVLAKINNNLTNGYGGGGGGGGVVGGGGGGGVSPKIQPPSACYDRYPKPGSYGQLQVFPMNGVNLNSEETAEEKHHRAQMARMREEESSKIEQDRLEEILKMCAEYEKQNQSITNSPIVQNRIKTNGSLPRDKKPFGELNSPSSPAGTHFFFPSPEPQKPTNSGYENVSFILQERDREQMNGGGQKYVPQSPRTKIRTCVSPKSPDRIKNEYDLLAQSFEDRLRLEIKNLRENRNYDSEDSAPKNEEIDELRKKRELALARVRDLKTQISELQRQEDEVFREFDLEKTLVSAELATVCAQLQEMEKNYQKIHNKTVRLEAQRNANRVMQETQQAKLKQSIDVKEDEVDNIEQLLKDNSQDQALRDDFNSTIEKLENDRKMFEDLEFQYLEEETEWMSHREELLKDLKTLTKSIEEKKHQIKNLEMSTFDNQKMATTDTKLLEENLMTLMTDLEKSRVELKNLDLKIFDVSGQQQIQSDSDDDIEIPFKVQNKMSQSLFGSNEILSSTNKKPQMNDIMSKSVNENLIFAGHNIECSTNGHFSSTPKKNLELRSMSLSSDSINRSSNQNIPALFSRQNSNESDPMLKLKYNLSSPPSDTKSKSSSPSVNLNLSLESDDFEVNPLDKRVPSQDDIDRISKVTADAPITTLGAASYKVKESIKEIERNRQLLLQTQGTHVIEHERQKMNDLKKKSHDEARAQYLQLQNYRKDDGYITKDTSLENRNEELNARLEMLTEKRESHQMMLNANQNRHSHPELDSNQHRPLSEISEASYDAVGDKPYQSQNDVRNMSSRLSGGDNGMTTDESNRNSFASQNESRLVSGGRRNVNKSQRPLTRYLPIMSSHLDLKQHVEKAGHQITLCPHVLIDEFCCRGYLHKLGATFHGWSRRWFVFDRQRCALIYYSDKSERKPRGGAYFSTIDDVYLDHLNTSKSGRPHCTFIVKTKKRSYHLQAPSDAAARIWIDVIITGAQGNIDY